MMYGRPNHTLITTMERAEGASKSPELIASSDDTKKPSQEVILVYLQHERLSTEVSRDTSRDMAGEVGRDPLLHRDKLDRYLSTDPEHTDDVLLWWAERKHIYPCLSRMALDYLSIPGKLYL